MIDRRVFFGYCVTTLMASALPVAVWATPGTKGIPEAQITSDGVTIGNIKLIILN